MYQNINKSLSALVVTLTCYMSYYYYYYYYYRYNKM